MSEMTLTQAADEVRKILRGFKAVEQVSEALERAGSIENACKEAEAKLAELRELTSKAQGEVVAAGNDIAVAKDEAKKLRAEAKDKADAALARAAAEADKILAAAKEAAAAEAAHAEAAKAQVADAAAAVEAAKAELADLEKRIEKAKSYLNKLVAGV